MAEFGAHLTTTTGDEDSPSIFEVLAQENLMATLRPALKYTLRIIAEKFPARFGLIYAYSNEVYTFLDLLLEQYYLRHYESSFAENFYGLKRSPLKTEHSGGTELTSKQRLSSLLVLVVLPYLRNKTDEWYEKEQDNLPDRRQEGLSAKLRCFIIRLYPVLHLVWEASIFIFQLLYVLRKLRIHNPLLAFCGLQLTTLSEDDILHQQSKAPVLLLQGKSLAAQSLAVARYGAGMLAVGVSSGLSICVFFLQFLDWWYASDQRSELIKALPNPAPPKKEVNENMPRLASICPLCNCMRTNDTALAVSGFVFCYPCIFKYVRDQKRCPVTGYPAQLDHLVRLYTPD